ncbi:HAD family hydrolase [Curtobacterium sp. Leaf261]|uniref:HAD family hydrolase n=1 Tax=Curtobacterium sp. Leaf261 TaxID=1736311 RepID=UPI00138F7CA0|nr:HAD family hydrolase [Curtobacterium sp. Leaf261]
MTNPVETVVLWDIDGTLVYNASSPGNLYHLALERTVGHDLEQLVGHQHGRTDAGIIADHLEAHGLDGGLRGTVSGHLQDLSAERSRAGDHRTAAAGVVALVARMAERGWHSGLLTGNSAFRAEVKLRGAGLDVRAFDWEHSYFGEQDVARSDITRRAASALSGRRAVIVGDTPRDGEAADAVGIPFLAVATGVFDVEALRATGAVTVARDCVVDADLILDAIAALPPLA